jgi:hypothetical protein
MKRIKLIAAVMCLPFLSMAQGPVSAVTNKLPIKVDLGIKVAANFANLNGKEWQSGYKPGISGGIFASVGVKRFAGSAEVMISSVRYTGNASSFYNRYGTGMSGYNNAADSSKTPDFAVTYVNIPVMLNVKLGGPLWIQVGPQYSGVIGVKDKNNLLKSTTGLFKTGDISGVLGLQLNVGKIRAGARYVIGLSDINNNSLGNSWKTRTIQLSLGYTFL